MTTTPAGRSSAERYLVRDGARTTGVERLADGTVKVDGAERPFQVTPAGPGCYIVSDGESAIPVFVAGPRDARYVSASGCTDVVEVESATARPRRKVRPGTGDGTVAPMPGTVIAIVVSEGQQVAAGDVLLKLEAMKMELPLRAPRDGVVTAIRCTAGELVQPGTTLIDLA